MPRSQSPTGNARLEAPPRLLAAEPPGAAFPASGWKQGFKGVAECQIISLNLSPC
ncbi:hypothetical protein [Nostoc sp.]|uniref:hypothetical protein n=1 Tax=Nostoc sp. TaxID=1180 RepID=UPI002FFA484F